MPFQRKCLAVFVFNSDEISDKISAVYGAYAQGEVLKALSKALEPAGGWEACLPVLLGCVGDLFEKSTMDEVPALSTLSSWLKTIPHINADHLDPDMVKSVKTGQDLGYIPYVVGIGPIVKSYAVAAHKELKIKGVVGYLGLLTLTGTIIPSLASALHLIHDKRIEGKKCTGWMVTSEDLREAGLERGF